VTRSPRSRQSAPSAGRSAPTLATPTGRAILREAAALEQRQKAQLAARGRSQRPYEVLAPRSVAGCDDGYLSLGVYWASSRGAAANRALRAVAADPLDGELEPILPPDPTLIAVPLSSLVPIEGLRTPQAILDAWEAA